MRRICPNPNCACPIFVIKDGKFKRKDDSKIIQRYRCKTCLARFSSATFSFAYRHKKRRVNAPLAKLFASGVSQRRAAVLMGVHHKTVELKFLAIARLARRKNEELLHKFKARVFNAQLDDLITKENSKLKPLSVSIVVDEDRRLILGTKVSSIPAFGHLADIARKKYGPRKDNHAQKLRELFSEVAPLISREVVIKSDEHKFYPSAIREFFPRSKHLQFKSERGCIAGQGELKKVGFDPLFVINHTCAMLRANINRLIRKTWCTTKNPHRLQDHLDIFTYFYNRQLLKRYLTPL